jgi:hypothetical protein
MAAQSFKNHTRFDPMFHFVSVPILLLNIIFSIVYCVRHFQQHRHVGPWLIVLSVGLLVLAGVARSSALRAQDRVIRLEEKLRLKELVSPNEMAELESLTVDQYCGLRFASNPELPELARRAVREKLTRKQIKEAIVSWRADEYRV